MLLHFKRTHFEQASRNSESGVFGSKIEKRNSESGVLGLKTWEFDPLDMMRTPRGGLGSVFGRLGENRAEVGLISLDQIGVSLNLTTKYEDLERFS